MKVFIQIIIGLLFCREISAQEDFKDTTWFTKSWNESPVKEKDGFYRVYKKTNSIFLVYDKYTNGGVQMIAQASAIKPLIKEGKTIYYDKNGLIERKGFYSDNKKTGVWVHYFNGMKDSSVYTLDEKGDAVYSRKSKLEQETFTVTEVMPEYPGGTSAMMSFLNKNIVYPEKALKMAIGGKVFIKFVVNESGNIENVQTIKGTGFEELDEEAMRVVRLMPQWKPGTQNNEAVRVYYTIPVVFRLTEPFYIYNTKNENRQYIKLMELIFSGKPDEAYVMLETIGETGRDTDFLYNKSVLLFHSKKKDEACNGFKNVLDIADNKSYIYSNSSTFYKNFCN